jgi:hypothetical protein
MKVKISLDGRVSQDYHIFVCAASVEAEGTAKIQSNPTERYDHE